MELLLPGGGGFPFDGGAKQQFTVAQTMVEATLLRLKQAPEFQVPCLPYFCISPTGMHAGYNHPIQHIGGKYIGTPTMVDNAAQVVAWSLLGKQNYLMCCTTNNL